MFCGLHEFYWIMYQIILSVRRLCKVSNKSWISIRFSFSLKTYYQVFEIGYTVQFQNGMKNFKINLYFSNGVFSSNQLISMELISNVSKTVSASIIRGWCEGFTVFNLKASNSVLYFFLSFQVSGISLFALWEVCLEDCWEGKNKCHQ